MGGLDDVTSSGVARRPCILSGEIRSAGALCDIISFLAHSSWWGEMIVEQGDTLRVLYIDEGHVVAAQSTADAERLGAVLVGCGELTEPQAEEGKRLATEKRIRFGEAIVELGHIGREALFALMKKQVEAIFSGIVAVAEGRFFFFEGFDDADLSFRHRLSVDGLLLDAIRKMDETKYFQSRIPSADHVPVRTTEAPASGDPLGIFDAIDGMRTVAEVAKSVGVAELDVTRALFEHVQAGEVAIKPPRLAARQMVEVYNDAIVVLLRELDAVGQGASVREQLAAFVAGKPESMCEVALPRADGTFDVDAVATKIAEANDAELQEERLKQWLYDYASYALFAGKPHLDREQDGASRLSLRVPSPSDIPRPAGLPRLTLQVEDDEIHPSNAPTDGDAKSTQPKPTSTLRLRRLGANMPGVDPSRTVRMQKLDVDALVTAKKTRRMAAAPSAPVPVPAAAPKPKATSTTPPPALRPPSAAVVALVAVVFFALGFSSAYFSTKP